MLYSWDHYTEKKTRPTSYQHQLAVFHKCVSANPYVTYTLKTIRTATLRGFIHDKMLLLAVLVRMSFGAEHDGLLVR